MSNRLERDSERKSMLTTDAGYDKEDGPSEDYVREWQRIFDAELARLRAEGMADWLAKLRAENYANDHCSDAKT